MDIEIINYYWGVFDSIHDANSADAEENFIFTGDEIPTSVLESFEEERIDEFEGEYGMPGIGEPEQVDVLTVTAIGSTKIIRVYNRAIMLFKTNDEAMKRLHRFLCVVQKAGQNS